MRWLARFDPGVAATGLGFIVVLQTSAVILLAASVGRAFFRWRAEARHGLWLGVLGLVLVSPVASVAAHRYGFGIWAIASPLSDQRAKPDFANNGLPSFVVQAAPSGPRADLPLVFELREAEPLRRFVYEPAGHEVTGAPSVDSSPRGSMLTGGLTLLWLVGALVGLARLGWGWVSFEIAISVNLRARSRTLRSDA
jgi:hypothetical protein